MIYATAVWKRGQSERGLEASETTESTEGTESMKDSGILVAFEASNRSVEPPIRRFTMHALRKLLPVAMLVFVSGVSLHAFDKAPPASTPPEPANAPAERKGIDNPNINMERYLAAAKEAAGHRSKRRVTEEEFLRMSREAGTIVLDARSKERFDLLHIKGAINLSFPDIDIESLQRTLPDKNARILIYCNNNFTGPREAFAPKSASLSLNLSTYIALYESGYRNVYELGPLLDPTKTLLTLESTPKAH